MEIMFFNPQKKTFPQHRSLILNCVKKNDLILGHAYQTVNVGVNKFHLKLFVPVGTARESYEQALIEGSFKRNTVKHSVVFLPLQLFQECVPGSIPYIQAKIEDRH